MQLIAGSTIGIFTEVAEYQGQLQLTKPKVGWVADLLLVIMNGREEGGGGG